MRTTRAVTKAVRKKTEYNAVYGGHRQEVQEPHPFLREVPRQNDHVDEQERRGRFNNILGELQQRRDGRPPSPQPEPSGLRRPFNRAKRQRNPCAATVELEIMKDEEMYDEINESEMMSYDTRL